MAYRHRDDDPEFADQWLEAVENALDLLHARVWQRSLEGDLEPIVYMGVVVGHVRKFDSKLQIEMLRAWQPQRFKTPGTTVNVGTKGDVFVLTEEQRREMQAITKERIASFPTDPVEWDKYLEDHSFRPKMDTRVQDTALEDETQEFRCIQCYGLFNRSQLAEDGKRCQQCAT